MASTIKSVTQIPQIWNLAVIPHLKKIKKCANHVTQPLSSADIRIFILGEYSGKLHLDVLFVIVS